VFAGLDAATSAEDVIQAVLDGVAMSLVDARDALGEAGRRDGAVAVIGGGARSRFWLRIIASALGLTVLRLSGADKGPAFGAAHLARMALTGEAPSAVCRKPEVLEEIHPEPTLTAAYEERISAFRSLYRRLKAAR
jgi:xylulokinase